MKSGSTSIALVAGLPMDRLNQSLALESEDCMVYSHIIRRDGTYVVRNGDAYRENYFTRMEEMIEDVNGGDSLPMIFGQRLMQTKFIPGSHLWTIHTAICTVPRFPSVTGT